LLIHPVSDNKSFVNKPGIMKSHKNLKRGLLFIVILLCVYAVSRASAQPEKLKWELGWAQKMDDAPAAWIPAEVPGAVQIDVAKSKKWDSFYYAENWKDYLPYEDNFFTTNFSKPTLKNGEHLFFIERNRL
jgi:hypothetical protein